MLKMIRRENKKKDQEPDSTFAVKRKKAFLNGFHVNSALTITQTDVREVEIEKEGEKLRESKVMKYKALKQVERKQKAIMPIQLPVNQMNKITIEETSEYSDNISAKITPDVSIVMDNVDISEKDNDNSFEEPVSPPHSREAISILNQAGDPIDTMHGHHEYHIGQQQESGYHSNRAMNSDERRKHRNREASRRYRERAREDPELLRKMREQQNARQKKYYARLRVKKMSSEEWDTSLEDGQWSG